MSDLFLETTRALVLLILLVYLWRAGSQRAELSHKSWKLMLAGFVLLFFGSAIDITDNYESLNHFVVIGDTEVQAFLEKMVGYLGGFVLLAIGLIQWLPTITGVEQLERAYEELSWSEEQFRKLYENMNSGVAVYMAVDGGKDFIFKDINRASEQIDNVNREEVLGNRVTDIFPNIVDIGLLDVFQRVWRTGTAEDHPVSFYEDERISGWRDNYVYKLSSENIVAMYEDVTKRKQTEEAMLMAKLAAEDSNRTKSEFLANMSHELRTPLNSVIGFSQVLKENASNHLDDKEIKYVSNVLKSGDHLLELINDILDISKAESGNMDYVPESVNIEEIIDGTIMFVSPMAKKKAIDLHVSFKHEYPDMQADRMKFKEVMYNLLNNAIKFTPEKGEVQVTTKIIDEKLHVSVSDTGIGIPEGKFKSIFDPFKQVDSSANRKFGGTGLGLSLVKKYVEMHDGEVWVESEIGKGSTFTFTVPLK